MKYSVIFFVLIIHLYIFTSFAVPDHTASYIRQLEEKVRQLEDGKRQLAQVTIGISLLTYAELLKDGSPYRSNISKLFRTSAMHITLKK